MKIIMKKYSYYSLVSFIFVFALYTLLSIHRYLTQLSYQNNNWMNVNKKNVVKSAKWSDEFIEMLDFDKIDVSDNSNNNNAVHERCLEEISKLKARIQSLETMLSRCEFKIRNHVSSSSFNKRDVELQIEAQRRIAETEADIVPFSSFTYDKLFSPGQDIYRRNVVKLTGSRKHELRGVVDNALKFLNRAAKSSRNVNNHTLSDFQIGFTRTANTGFEYELFFRDPLTRQCCSHIKMQRRLNPDLELVEFTHSPADPSEDTEAGSGSKKTINFVLPLSSGERSERAFRLFMSSFESVVVNEDAGQAALVIAFQGSQAHLEHFNELVDEFKKRTKFEAVRFVHSTSGNKFSRSLAIQNGIDALNCDPNDCLVFVCDVDVLFNRNFLDLCRSNAVKGKRVFFPILYSFYNPSMLVSQHYRTSGENDSIETDSDNDNDDDQNNNKRINLIINKETGFWRESGFGMACLHREDFRSVSGFDGFGVERNNKNQQHVINSWGGEDLYLFRKFVRSSSIQVFRSFTPGLFHLYHSKECDKDQLTARQYHDCLTAKILNEASHRDFGLIYFNFTRPSID